MPEEGLDTFAGWENADTEINFFGTESIDISTKAEDVVEQAAETEEKEGNAPTTTTETKTETEEIDFFSSEVDNEGDENLDTNSEEEEELEESSGTESTSSNVDVSISTVNFLKEKGMLDFEMEEGSKLTPEIAAEILEDSFEEKTEERIKELFNELPDVVKDLNKFALKGGNIEDFFKSVSKTNSNAITKDIDLETEDNQILVVSEELKKQGFDKEYVDTQIDFLKDSGKLKTTSEVHYNKWEERVSKERKALVAQQEADKKQEKENRKRLKNEVSSLLATSEDINGIKFSDEEKKDLPGYMTEKSIKLKNGGNITAMQRDLGTALQDQNKALLIAKIVKSDFDFESLKAEVQTEVTKNVKKNIRRNKDNTPNKSGGSGSQTKKGSLADYF